MWASALESHADEHVEVEVHLLGAHPADVEGEHGPVQVGGLLDVVVHHDGAEGDHLEVLGRDAAPGRAKPSSRASVNSPMWAGEKKIGNQPSAISAARATFFGPSAPRTMGMSVRSGWTMALSGLPRPVPARIGQRVVGPVVGDGRLAGEHLADDRDVLARAGQGLRERLAVPTLDHLGARDAETEDEPARRTGGRG